MINLLRMDLYRVKRGRSLYVCFGILQIMVVMTFALLWLMATPEGQKTAVRIGMLALQDLKESAHLLEGADIIMMFRQIGMDGGMYSVVFGIWVMMFVCMDYQSGFVKNIMALHQNRWNYIGSKILTVGIVNFFYLALHFAFAVLMNWLFGNMVPYAGAADVLFYLSWAWMLTTAFAALVIFVCVWFRSVAAGTLAAVLFGGGAVVMPLYGVLNLFHAGEWLKHTIYLTLSMGPDRYAAVEDLGVYVTGAGFLVLYGVLAGAVLKKQDI